MFNGAHIRFVILAVPRSGSNMLCSLLHSHPKILCHHELYNPADLFYALPLRNSDFQLATRVQKRDEQPLEFLDKIWRNNLSHQCVGFKMTHRQNPTVFEQLLADKRIKKIILKRSNVIKIHVSKLIAERNGLWEVYRRQRNKKNTTVTVDVQQLNNDIQFNQAYYDEIEAKLKGSGQDYCVVEYESLNLHKTRNTLLGFLDMPIKKLVTQSVKQNATDLSTLIRNYDELLQGLCSPVLKKHLTDQSM